jgi:cyclase
MCGLDLDLLRKVTRYAKVPVIGAGGVGNYHDLLDGYRIEGIDAISVASLFHFSDSNPYRAKATLQNHNLNFKLV